MTFASLNRQTLQSPPPRKGLDGEQHTHVLEWQWCGKRTEAGLQVLLHCHRVDQFAQTAGRVGIELQRDAKLAMNVQWE